ncbi:tartrate-resistant acid phosphatase type 5 family protein [Nguyenibacter sp. L1]|uniref:purple acid phosphatase family protein n=1 Tax=Nguyenibacter sp. L1 TaxID=3049350 RepID=UPI002B4831C3|nr:tartrate-resistant acid phosphatase type 5 family protein [Nguyenibacter sp. L1]WRH89238.1 tartrate-resistant acid phosphatase type 5 family protein [Nguyenibacter sp. L1]
MDHPTRRFLLGSAAALSASALCPPAFWPRPAAARALTHNFVVIGDWGRQGHYQQRALGARMGQVAADFGSLYTVSLGDNFYDDGVTSVDDPNWDLSFESIYRAPSLRTPWRVILGNHDYRGNVAAQLEYGRARDSRWSLPARYYTRIEHLPDGSPAEFFFIDTSPFISTYRGTKVDIAGQDTARQVAWLDRELGRSRAVWKIVIGHHPIHTAEGRFDEPDLIAAILPVLKRHGVTIYVNGHIHNLQYIERDGIHFINNGAGSRVDPVGAPQPGGFTAPDQHGFMTVSLDRDRFDFSFINLDGRRIFGRTVPRLA